MAVRYLYGLLLKYFMRRLTLMIACIINLGICFAQRPDSLKAKELQEVEVKAWMRRDVDRMPDELNGFLNVGKKSEVITVNGVNANIAVKAARQLFSKVPGLFVYDMDGSGNQLNIATRGLDPHRSWEFNVRQNGIIINSDMYGYPASHYSAPVESFEKIELVRGTGALQYGAQFGGIVNYVTKKPDSAKSFAFENVSTAGSFGLLSTYNAIGGTVKKFSYYAYYYRRHSNGYRKNSESGAEAQFVQLHYRFSEKLTLNAQIGRSKYLYRIPGPLNDSMFRADPAMSTRSRNYFSPDIYVPSLMLQWQLSSRTKVTVTASGLFGNRSSVQLDAFATVPDVIDPGTGQYKNRQVDIDNFHSRTTEARLMHQYQLGKIAGKLAAGVLYMNNDLHRRQLGKGTTGSDYDLTLVDAAFGRDLHFRSENIALFVENAFVINDRWTISPGVRWESGTSRMSGTIVYYPSTTFPNSIPHRFVLAGISTRYQLDKDNALYGGMSQAYRPVLFKDIIPASVFEQVDKSLKDATGYNLEAGVRGKVAGSLQYDVNFFSLLYRNRMGTLVLQDNAGQPYIFRTNIGDSRTNGMELFAQYKFPVAAGLYAGIFTSTAYLRATYIRGQVAAGTVNKSIVGNKVESAPRWISRTGLDILFKTLSITLLYNYTAATFSDALNTVEPPPTGARGFTPAYSIWDLNASLRVNQALMVRAGAGNIFNKQYFTKRPTFYPGPGIWPGDGRNYYVTVGCTL